MEPAMIEITINPSNMSKEQAELLEQLCGKHNLHTFWSARDLHTISANNQDYQIRLTHNVYRKNDGTLTCFDSQAELSQLNQVECAPGTAQVYPETDIKEMSAPTNSNKQGPERVIKAINLTKILDRFDILDKKTAVIENEIKQANKAGQLDMRLDAINDNTVYVSMNKAPGQPLNQLLKEDLNSQQRSKLCLAIAQTVRTLLADNHIIHRDLKPDNIFVDMSQQPYLVTILDYGKAIETGVRPNDTRGTPMYDAPETWSHMSGDKTHYYQGNKVDVFALGRIFSRIWDNANFKKYSCHQGNWSEDKKDSLVLDLFDNIIEPPSGVVRRIECSISQMLCVNPNERSNLNDIIQSLQEIALDIAFKCKDNDAYIKDEVREIIVHKPSLSMKYESLLLALNAVENQNKSFITIYDTWRAREQSPISAISLGFSHQGDIKNDPINEYVAELKANLTRQHAWLKTVKQIIDSKSDFLQKLNINAWSRIFADFESDEGLYIQNTPNGGFQLVNQVVTLATKTDIKGKTDLTLEKFLFKVSAVDEKYHTEELSEFIQNKATSSVALTL